MNEFTASNGEIVSVLSNARIAVSDSTVVQISARATQKGHTSYLDKPQIQALREFFQHERDEGLGWWRSVKDPTWTAVRRNNVAYFQNEDHERSFHAVLGDKKSLNAWSTDLQEIAREYIAAHPEPKPWADAKPGEVWVVTISGEEIPCKVTYSGPDFEPLGDPIWVTIARGSEHIENGRRIWPEAEVLR